MELTGRVVQVGIFGSDRAEIMSTIPSQRLDGVGTLTFESSSTGKVVAGLAESSMI